MKATADYFQTLSSEVNNNRVAISRWRFHWSPIGSNSLITDWWRRFYTTYAIDWFDDRLFDRVVCHERNILYWLILNGVMDDYTGALRRIRYSQIHLIYADLIGQLEYCTNQFLHNQCGDLELAICWQSWSSNSKWCVINRFTLGRGEMLYLRFIIIWPRLFGCGDFKLL